MKSRLRNIIFYITIVCAIETMAQAPNYNLQTDETGTTKNYVARDYISLKPGFRYEATTGKSFVARIDENLLLPAGYQPTSQLPNPYNVDTSLPVGAVAGNANLSPSGAAVYQIPIQIPEGVNGMQPSISVIYNSQGENGILGYGWTLSAFSMITRTGNSYYFDGSISAPGLTNNDNLLLDGQRLVRISGMNLSGNDDLHYTTEIESYSEITLRPILNRLYFKVRTKNGSVLEYGATTDSNIEAQGTSTTLAWLLNKVTDKNGNYTTYHYEEKEATGEFYLKRIEYAGNAAAGFTPACKIEFFYETRKDTISSFVAGKQQLVTVLLNRIKTAINGNAVKEYKLNYFYDGFYSKLTEITEYGDNKNSYFNSTKIDWGDYSGAVSREKTEYTVFLPESKASNFISIYTDFDGDGRTEMVFDGYANNAVIVKTFDDNQNLLVRNIVDGLGNITYFSYTAISEEYANYSETATTAPLYPVVRNKIPLIVLKYITQSVAGNVYSSYTYSYKNLRMHKQGRGFLCFEGVTAIDNMKLQRTVTNYDYNTNVFSYYQYYHPYITGQKVYSTISGELLSTTVFTDTCLTLGPKRFFPYIASQKQINHLTGDSITTAFRNLEYGNPKSITKDYGGNLSESVSIVYQNTINDTVRMTGLPQTVQTTQTKEAQSWTNKEEILYNARFLPAKITTYTNNGAKKTGVKSFTYDLSGNNLTDTVKNYSSNNALVTSRSFSSDGLLLWEKNILGLQIDYQYDSKRRLKSLKDHKNNVIRFEYDIFGRQTKQVNPDGTEIASVLAWESDSWDSDLTGVRYSVTQTVTGKPTVKTLYDGAGRDIRSIETCFNGSQLKIDKQYDYYGRLWKTSLPYKTSSSPLWNTYAYDDYNRPISLTYASGKTDTWAYNEDSITVTKDGVRSTKTYNAAGQLVSASDAGGTITYNLRPDGQLASITAFGNIVTSFGYDDYGRQTSINDPSAGLLSYSYNASGNTDTVTNANGKKTVMQYDVYNRLINKVFPEFSTSYLYNSDGLLTNETSTNGTSTIYTYDNFGRISSIKENAPDNKWLQKTFAYGGGNIQSIGYSANTGSITTENYYYANGHLSEIKLNGQTSIWKLDGENNFGMPSNVATGVITRTYDYDSYGLPAHCRAKVNQGSYFQNVAYSFNHQTGNLSYRDDDIHNTMEDFYYDNLDRLTGVLINGNASHPVTYNNKGNITNNDLAGAFQYNNPHKPFAVTGAMPYDNAIPLRNQTISYTSFQRPDTINENNYRAVFTCNSNAVRVKMQVTNNNSAVLTRYYIGNYETDVTPVGTTQRLYLGGDAYTAPAVLIKNGAGNWSVYSICRDYLGSITHITDASGNLLYEYNYDAWGRLRNPATQAIFNTGSEPNLFLGRGFTGHEHLPWFGLINMNARLYDPVLGRFLSPDPYVQMPDFSQSFNRYSYALNNPLRYTDPNGEIVWWLAAAIIYTAFFTDFGYDVQKTFFPVAIKFDLRFGNHQGGIGIDISVGIPQVLPLSYRVHGGATYFWKNEDLMGNNMKGWETRYGAEWGIALGPVFKITYGGTTFHNKAWGKQTTNLITLGNPLINLKYENDMKPMGPFKYIPFVPKGDGDRYRTAAAQFNIGPLGIGTNMMTGDAGPNRTDPSYHPEIDGHETYIENNGYNPNSHRMGTFYFRIGPLRFGKNSENTRKIFQNQFAHDFLTGGQSKWFEVLNLKPRWYWGFGYSGGGTLW